MQVVDQTGYDLLEGLGMARDKSAVEQAVIRYASTSLHPCVDESDTLTLVVTGNAAASATTAITLYYALGY